MIGMVGGIDDGIRLADIDLYGRELALSKSISARSVVVRSLQLTISRGAVDGAQLVALPLARSRSDWLPVAGLPAPLAFPSGTRRKYETVLR